MGERVGSSNALSDKKKKAPGKEWEFANNVCGRYVMWQSKLCLITKSGVAPCIRENIIGGPKKPCCMCTQLQAPVVAKCLREEISKKSTKR